MIAVAALLAISAFNGALGWLLADAITEYPVVWVPLLLWCGLSGLVVGFLGARYEDHRRRRTS